MGEPDPVQLMLFVRGNAEKSKSAIQAVTRACASRPETAGTLRVLDIMLEPALAAKHRVIATPTLVRRGRNFEHRVVGNVSEQAVLDCFSEETHVV